MKTCTKCGKQKGREDFSPMGAGKGVHPRCRECRRVAANNRVGLVCVGCSSVFDAGKRGLIPTFCGDACRRKFDESFKTRRKAEERRYISSAKGRANRAAANRRYRQRVGIEPAYVVANWLKGRLQDIPPEIIELKREQLRLHRLAKQLEQAATTAKENDEPVQEHP